MRDFPGGPIAETLNSQCRGPTFDPWSGKEAPRATTKSSHAATERTCMLQLRLSAATQINTFQTKKEVQTNIPYEYSCKNPQKITNKLNSAVH